jgi:hypothetical protein
MRGVIQSIQLVQSGTTIKNYCTLGLVHHQPRKLLCMCHVTPPQKTIMCVPRHPTIENYYTLGLVHRLGSLGLVHSRGLSRALGLVHQGAAGTGTCAPGGPPPKVSRPWAAAAMGQNETEIGELFCGRLLNLRSHSTQVYEMRPAHRREHTRFGLRDRVAYQSNPIPQSTAASACSDR